MSKPSTTIFAATTPPRCGTAAKVVRTWPVENSPNIVSAPIAAAPSIISCTAMRDRERNSGS